MRNSPLREKSFSFALGVIASYKTMQRGHREYTLSRQLLRSGTSIGAMIRESEYASSRADFINKLTIALKEANETSYWLDLLVAAEFLEPSIHRQLSVQCLELIKMLTASINTVRRTMEKH